MFIPIKLECEKRSPQKAVATTTLTDSGAGGVFLNTNFAQTHRLPLHWIKEPLAVFNVDGT